MTLGIYSKRNTNVANMFINAGVKNVDLADVVYHLSGDTFTIDSPTLVNDDLSFAVDKLIVRDYKGNEDLVSFAFLVLGANDIEFIDQFRFTPSNHKSSLTKIWERFNKGYQYSTLIAFTAKRLVEALTELNIFPVYIKTDGVKDETVCNTIEEVVETCTSDTTYIVTFKPDRPFDTYRVVVVNEEIVSVDKQIEVKHIETIYPDCDCSYYDEDTDEYVDEECNCEPEEVVTITKEWQQVEYDQVSETLLSFLAEEYKSLDGITSVTVDVYENTDTEDLICDSTCDETACINYFGDNSVCFVTAEYHNPVLTETQVQQIVSILSDTQLEKPINCDSLYVN